MKLAAAAIVAFVFAAPMSSEKPSSQFWDGYGAHVEQPVEQQSPNWFYNSCGAHPENTACDPTTWVSNPTGCAWDVDDYVVRTGAGTLGTAATSLCLIADGTSYDGPYANNKTVKGTVTASTATLTLTLTSSVGGVWTAPPPTLSAAGDYVYLVCTVDVTPGPYPILPDSNGGHGVRIDYTLTVTAAKRAHVTAAQFIVRGGGC